MISRWLTWLNSAILGVLFLLGLGIVLIWLAWPSEIFLSNPKSKPNGLPKTAFEFPPAVYQQIGGPLLALQNASPSLQLPDLKQHLIYYGKNGRPDAQSNHTLLHFSFAGNKAVVSTPPGEPLYLLYDKKSNPGRYIFSPNNERTSLWIEGVPVDAEVQVKVAMENDKGELITEPESCAQFRLAEKEFIRYAGSSWEIGTWRVDGTLLARQRARWFGPDRFLEKHGGQDYQDSIGKQRIDFGENDDIYSVFVKVGDCLVWDKNRWTIVQPGESSLNHPLLVVKKIEDRLMTFELWDVEGKGKILLNLLKSTEPWTVQNAQQIQHMFKFVGARTRSQCVFEINHERMVICPSDWLLLTPKGWKKLTTEEDIDNYVKRKITGTLFVFEGLSRKDERQVMVGTLYNPTRSDSQTIELSLQQGGGNKPLAAKDNKETKETKEVADIIGEKIGLMGGKAEGDRNAVPVPPVMPVPMMPPKTQSSNQ
ncbi:hypothetical protein [Candidatus Protochlamydia phocaeensis]|uniref:hypothetical protein n=1 Tax=Candidatus Protochlamydia phocaeensis TaxID=1414722 RepID=UPI0008392DF3|nr:hypothetical protein [Candidatus Protochlamydia phocaeensis]